MFKLGITSPNPSPNPSPFIWRKPTFIILHILTHLSTVLLSSAADWLFVSSGIPYVLWELHALWLQSGCGQLPSCGKTHTHTQLICLFCWPVMQKSMHTFALTLTPLKCFSNYSTNRKAADQDAQG